MENYNQSRSRNRVKLFKFLASNIITAIVSITIAIINAKSDDEKIRIKLENTSDALLDSIRVLNVKINQNITQNNQHGDNFAGDQNNNQAKK